MNRSFLALILLVPFPVLAALDGPGMHQEISAARATSQLQIDGSLHEPAWEQAPMFDGFVQIFPTEGATPSERTELRVVYDDRYIYFGFRCHDSKPAEIVRKLGRRDNPPASDTIQVLIDSTHDHRTAYVFGISASGIQFDGLQLSDNTYTAEWDAAWDGAAVTGAGGWSAELAIPVSAFRFGATPEQVWGFGVQRYLARAHEDISSVLIPRNSTGKVSRFGHLVGLRGIRPRPTLDITPYAATRGVIRPKFSDPGMPNPRLLEPSLDLGLDLNAALSSDLALSATVNPDFGQVEADQIILNLTNVESFFPEKRPFFIQGMDLFEPVGAQGGIAPQMLFYSRRIGLTTPILAAVKLVGSVSPSVEIGLLDALVMDAPRVDIDEANPDRRLELNLQRPLHLGLRSERAGKRPIPQNYLVGVSKLKLAGGSRLGARVTAATPLTGTCTAADAALDPALQPASCLALGGNAAAIDWDVRTTDAEWVFRGQLDGSQVVSGPPERTLRDGVVLRPGDLGWGVYAEAGKLGGEPFRFDLKYRRASPLLELNAAGYLPSQNVQYVGATARFVRPGGLGPLHAFESTLTLEQQWSTDGRLIDRGRGVWGSATAQLPGFHLVSVEGGYFSVAQDIREIIGTGIPFERVAQAYALAFLETDSNQPLSFVATGVAAFYFGIPSLGNAMGWNANVEIAFRPEERLETKLVVSADETPHGPRWVDSGASGQYIFGNLRSRYLSMTLRQQWVIGPRLTVQGYAQLFTDLGRFGPFYQGTSFDRSLIRLSDLSLFDYPIPVGFHGSALNLDFVLRWEYRPGSTVFLVYTREQSEPPLDLALPLPDTWLPVRLFSGPVTDALLLKLSYRWDL